VFIRELGQLYNGLEQRFDELITFLHSIVERVTGLSHGSTMSTEPLFQLAKPKELLVLWHAAEEEEKDEEEKKKEKEKEEEEEEEEKEEEKEEEEHEEEEKNSNKKSKQLATKGTRIRCFNLLNRRS